MAIQLYVVGIYFNKSIPFTADAGKTTMSGDSLLKAAMKHYPNFTAELLPNGLLTQFGYTPTSASDFKAGSGSTSLIGKTLILNQNLEATFPACAQVLQYTSSLPPVTPTSAHPPFGTNGFQDGSDIRIRLVNIYLP